MLPWMDHATIMLRVTLASSLAVLTSCATLPEGDSGRGEHFTQVHAVQVKALPGGASLLSFGQVPIDPSREVLTAEEARVAIDALYQALASTPPPQVVLTAARSHGSAVSARAAWEQKLREEFISRYGPPLLPMPEVLERSPVYMALKLSPRYMGRGARDAAEELFKSPVFLASVTLSVLVYFAAWIAPEPFFSKAFAASLTVRLAMVVGVLELRNVAMACLQLYEDAQAARTMKELEVVAERFGRALGGTALRVLVMVATFGVSKALPSLSPGGLGALMGSPRYAVAGGPTLGTAATAHIMADSSIIVTGAAVGTAASAARGSGGACGDGSAKKDGYRWHHLATNKNEVSSVRGGPWTPRFEDLFMRAGMGLNARENQVYLAGHQGPHPEQYHLEVFRRLEEALGECQTPAQCKPRLLSALKELASELCTPGSRLHTLATRTHD